MSTNWAVLKQYARIFTVVVPKLLWQITFGIFITPKETYHQLERILELKDLFQQDKHLKSKSINDICSGDANVRDVVIIGNYHTDRSSDTRQLKELSSIAFLCRAMSFNKIFEIGTFVGRMTRIIAINSGKNAIVYTLDLPQKLVPHIIGEFYHDTDESERITQLYGDSTLFDYSPWYNEIDFCWVDACHDFEFAYSDTIVAFKMVKDGGWIGWHDYRHSAPWAGVTKAVRMFNSIIGGGIIHINGTTTAVLQVTADMKNKVGSV
ncbi:MAG: class I SAM-dependent methyltransferase [Desulfuromonadaceae bacterium]|nr:class I SAM-dependent methyltransferase [Desulfuromonadaceae bacterium]